MERYTKRDGNSEKGTCVTNKSNQCCPEYVSMLLSLTADSKSLLSAVNVFRPCWVRVLLH